MGVDPNAITNFGVYYEVQGEQEYLRFDAEMQIQMRKKIGLRFEKNRMADTPLKDFSLSCKGMEAEGRGLWCNKINSKSFLSLDNTGFEKNLACNSF